MAHSRFDKATWRRRQVCAAWAQAALMVTAVPPSLGDVAESPSSWEASSIELRS